MEFGTIETILGCARAGMGIGVVTRSVAEAMIPKDTVLIWEAVPSPWGAVTTMFTYRKEGTPSPAMKACLNLLQEAAKPEASPPIEKSATAK